MAELTAAALIALAAWLVLPSAREGRARRLARGPGEPAPEPLHHRLRLVVLAVAGRVGMGPASRRRLARQRVRVVQALGALAAELQAGQLARAALLAAAGQPPVWPSTVSALRLDGDVVGALLVDAKDHAVLQHLAACWQVSAASGTGLSAAVSRLATSARAAEDTRVNLEAQLAGPRATARMLALLPVVGIGLGMMLGAEPLAWLLTTPFGMACLAAGASLTAVGMWWTGRIAASVEKML